MIEWIHGFRCRSVCGRFSIQHRAYGLWSLWDLADPDAPSVTAFRSMKDAKREAARRKNR